MEKEQKLTVIRMIATFLLLGASYIPAFSGLARAILLIASYLIVGFDILYRAVKNILRGEVFDENFLMAIATVGAFAIGEWPEAVVVMLFYQIGEFFQDMALDKSRKSIAALMDIKPDFANIEKDGGLLSVSPDSVGVGEIIVVKPGEKVPLDGEVLEGRSSLNTTALTGESLPRDVAAGDLIVSGCVNMTGLLRVRVSSVFAESTVSKILNLVENTSANKAKAEHFITRFAKIYTPCVVFGALALAVLPALFLGDFANWLHRALIFLVISCPCALVISVPLTFFGGIGGASKQGILVKGSNYLEALARSEIVAFDKTGTLTKGVFTVTAIHPEKISENALIELAALAESYSDHPISASLRAAYNRAIDQTRVSDVVNFAGEGICAQVDGRSVYAGNDKLMARAKTFSHECHKQGTIVHVAFEGEYLGHIVISDEIKPEAAEAIRALKAAGVRKTVMLTGDRKAVADEVAKTLAVDEAQSELLPSGKVEAVERLLLEKHGKGCLVFVGDGINDAPVLSRADIGIAMGALGSAAATEAADIVLMDDNPAKIARAIDIARKTLRIVRQNIVFALAVKALVLLLGALGIANMWAAVFADVGVSLLAILNATRMLKG